MDNQASANYTGKWNTIKSELSGAANRVKNWYTNYKNSDYKQIRRKCSAEIMLCTKNAPDTPIHSVTVNSDIMISLLDLGLLAAGCAMLCIIAKFIRCRL
jgi:hypothetical protein